MEADIQTRGNKYVKISASNDYTDEVRSYFKEINKYKPLTKKEEQKLGEKIKLGDEKAREKLIKANLRFVVNVAKNYKGLGIPFGDLIAEGNIGLMKASEKFNFDKDVKFITYGVWWIKQSIQDYIKRTNGSRYFEVPNELPSAENAFVDEDGNEFESSNDNSDYQKPFSNSDADDNTDHQRKLIKEIFSVLDEREKGVIIDYFGLGTGEPLTLGDIGRKFDLSKERVRQIKESVMRKMRAYALLHPEAAKLRLLIGANTSNQDLTDEYQAS